MEQPEFPVREIRHEVADARLPAREIEQHATSVQNVLVLAWRDRAPELDADAREQLVECERLRHVVGGAELEPAELRLHVAARGEDHDRQLRLRALQLLQDLEPVQPGQQ